MQVLTHVCPEKVEIVFAVENVTQRLQRRVAIYAFWATFYLQLSRYSLEYVSRHTKGGDAIVLV